MRRLCCPLGRFGWRSGRSLAFAFLAGTGAASPGLAQCTPQELTKLIASDAASTDLLGCSVAISGDTAVVGAYLDDHAGGADAGAAYVYVRFAGVWTQQQKLTASDAMANDLFGWAATISGDTVVIGARSDDHTAGTDAGSAYVFVRTAGVWTQQQKLTASDSFARTFGQSVAIEGDTVVVGAISDNLPLGAGGAAYVFVRSAGVWTQQQKLTALDAANGDAFGYSVALSGQTAVIGAYLDDRSSLNNTGAAYAFVRSGAVWTQQAKLIASDAASDDFFGWSIALSGNTAVVGAWFDDVPGGGNDAGSAYVFTRAGAAWTQQQKLTASDSEPNLQFGESVGISGDTVLVGAPAAPLPGFVDAGACYVFVRSSAGGASLWSQMVKLTASDAENDIFGDSVAISGDMAMVGAIWDDHSSQTDAGSVYVFDLNCDNDGDGVMNADDACPNNSPGLAVSCTGRPLRDCNNDCLLNALDVQCVVAEMLGQ